MKQLILHPERIRYPEIFVRSCPFSALILTGGAVAVTPDCRLCGVCVRQAKDGECEIIDTEAPSPAGIPAQNETPPVSAPPAKGRLLIHNERIPYTEVFIRCCPFSALVIRDGRVEATAACRLCGVCVRKAKNGECEMVGNDSEGAVLGYGCSYLFGVIFVVLFVQLFTKKAYQ